MYTNDMKNSTLLRNLLQTIFIGLFFMFFGIANGYAQKDVSERIPEEEMSGHTKSAMMLKSATANPGSIEVAENTTYNAYSAAELVQNILVSGCLKATNIKFGYYSTNGTTWNNATWSSTPGNRQLGYFNKGTSDFPLSEGIILSTGKISSSEGPNDLYSKTDEFNDYHEDPDLETIAGYDSNDAAVLEFDFVPAGNTLEFRYIFASEEYREWSCSQFNDAFGFFLSGPGITGKVNLAKLPNGTEVTINNIHGEFTSAEADDYDSHGPVCTSSSNIAYYVDNGSGLSGDTNNSPTLQFDGMTVILTATYDVTPCSTYHIKLAIADISDKKWDSGVFIEAKSFNSNSANIYNIGGGIINNTDIFESDNSSCNNTIVVERTSVNNSLPVTFPLNLSGTFTNGTDIVTVPGGTQFPTSVTIPAGQNSVSINYKAVNDGVSDNNETFIVELEMGCPCDPSSESQTITMTIHDPIVISTATTPDECDENTNNGEIEVTASGGTGNFLYSIDGTNFQNSNTFTGLSYGAYTVYVKEAGGLDCNSTTTATCTVEAVNCCTETVTASSNSPVCEGDDIDLTATAIAGGSYSWSGPAGYTSIEQNPTRSNALTSYSGNYIVTVNYDEECVAKDTVGVIVIPSTYGTDTQTACDSYTWIDGVEYTSSNNSATHTLTNVAGCDSVVALDLTINYSNTGTDTQTACDSYTWIDGVEYTSSNNTATHTLTNVAGCDSVVTLDLTI
ncbi:MAG: choice-of-anchor L domain-containing protein, partial [Draconibacterium sp.]|nr:choice-of-anchor L domain-containing protein [Draconibacterium sp.]